MTEHQVQKQRIAAARTGHEGVTLPDIELDARQLAKECLSAPFDLGCGVAVDHVAMVFAQLCAF